MDIEIHLPKKGEVYIIAGAFVSIITSVLILADLAHEFWLFLGCWLAAKGWFALT